MTTKLQQTVLKNVINSTFSDEKDCLVYFSRHDKYEISLMKKLFDFDVKIKNLTTTDSHKKWSDMINSSQLEVSFVAQAQYISTYMQELFPDIQPKIIKKP